MLTANQAIGDYVIKEGPFGGVSGFGELYKAVHVNDRNTLVALKVSKHQTVDDEKRFRLENQILHELKGHNGIIKPHTLILEDAGLGIIYYCMELADMDIAEHLAKASGPMSATDSLDMFKQICEATKHAHNKKVVHRDLHNQNILINKSKSGMTVVKLTDFGRAKFFNSAPSSYATGTLWGRYDTRAPESFFEIWADSDLEKYATTSDIFSMGVILAFLFNVQPSTFINSQLQSIARYFIQSGAGSVSWSPSPGLWIKDIDTADKQQHYDEWLKTFSYAAHVTQLTAFTKDPIIASKVNGIIAKCCNPDHAKRYKSVDDIIKELEMIC